MTTKLHDLAPIRATIKELAHDARDLRRQARETFGMDRWALLHEANELAPGARYNLLAYGYLRGLTIEQMESPYTREPARLSPILAIAKTAFRKLVEESDEERAAAWQEFSEHIKADLKQWNAACHLRVLQRDTERQVAKAVA